MNILGPDELVFGVKDIAACAQYFTDYGLTPVGVTAAGGRFEALDGTAVVIRGENDTSLPPMMGSTNPLRETVYGVADEATLSAIAAELGKDRVVTRAEDGSLRTADDMGFALRFKVTVRRPYTAPAERVNSPGSPPQRAINEPGTNPQAVIKPRTLSHVVLFVPDSAKAEAFYERLGFRCTDRFTGVGPFLQPGGALDHHALFMIETPPHMKGIEHFAFHLGGPTEMMQAGTLFVEKGYQSFWGPGRHLFGSNWFWYFNSPLGCHVEYDADMDLHDKNWTARVADMGKDTSQLFLFQRRDRWAPSGPPPQAAPKPEAAVAHAETMSH